MKEVKIVNRASALLFSLLWGVVLIALLTLSFGCTKKVAPVSTGPEEVSIIWLDDQYEEGAMALRKEAVIEPFTAAFPNVKIEFRPMTDTTKEIRIQLAAGKGPDFMSLDGPTDAMQLMAENRIIDLKPFVQEYQWDKIIFPWALGSSTSKDGKITSIPNSWEGMVFYWNNDILQKEGWKVPQTYADLQKINQEVRARGYIAPIHTGTSGVPRYNEWWQSALFGSYSGGEAIKKLLSGQSKYTDPLIRGVFETHFNIWNNGVLGNKDTFAITRDDARALFMQGQMPFHMEGSWFLTNLIRSDMKNFGVGIIPSFREGFSPDFSLAIGSAFAINSASTPVQQKAIADLINFMFTQEDIHIRAIEKGMQPLPRDLNESKFSSSIDPHMKEMLAVLNDKMAHSNVSYCTWTFFPQDTRIYMYENMDNVFLGKMTMDAFLAGAQASLDKAIAAGEVPSLP
jgi:raffinose/stachyose/melibiose transport system substrate-binding protein